MSMMARSTMLQHKAGYIDARPPTASSSKSSCYARSIASVELSRHVGFTLDFGRIGARQRNDTSGRNGLGPSSKKRRGDMRCDAVSVVSHTCDKPRAPCRKPL